MRQLQNPDDLNKVAEFHRAFNHPVEEKPCIPVKARRNLRKNLIAEEVQELFDAIDKGDLNEIADALCDLQYVLTGTVLEFGFTNDFFSMFNEVHRSNMSKACTTQEEAAETISFYRKQGIDCYYKAEGPGRYPVYRTSDNKTMKSVNYSPANLKLYIKHGHLADQ